MVVHVKRIQTNAKETKHYRMMLIYQQYGNENKQINYSKMYKQHWLMVWEKGKCHFASFFVYFMRE